MTPLNPMLEEATRPLLAAYVRAVDAHVISSITDTRGTIVHVNEMFCETSQYSAAELVGQNHRIVNSGLHAAPLFKEMWQTIGAGRLWRGEIRNKTKSGTFYWVDSVVVPIKDEHGRNTHYLSLRSLITARKQAESDRQRHVDALEALLVMTSHRIRQPLAECLERIRRMETGAEADLASLRDTLARLGGTVATLEGFTRELDTFIRDMSA